MVTLKPMTQEVFKKYAAFSMEEYAKEKVAAGNWAKEEAQELSQKEYKRLLPEDEKSKFNYLYSIFNNEEEVGIIWLAHKNPNKNLEEGFIYDFMIYDRYQGKGFGKAAMKEVETKAKELGMNKIGLHVFGHNKTARGLYEKMGYEITNIEMAKSI